MKNIEVDCPCPCHNPGSQMMHIRSCCEGGKVQIPVPAEEMTVDKLIAELQKFNGDMLVLIDKGARTVPVKTAIGLVRRHAAIAVLLSDIE